MTFFGQQYFFFMVFRILVGSSSRTDFQESDRQTVDDFNKTFGDHCIFLSNIERIYYFVIVRLSLHVWIIISHSANSSPYYFCIFVVQVHFSRNPQRWFLLQKRFYHWIRKGEVTECRQSDVCINSNNFCLKSSTIIIIVFSRYVHNIWSKCNTERFGCCSRRWLSSHW